VQLQSYLNQLDKRKESMAEQVIQWANVNSNSFNVPGLERMSALLTQAFSTLECEGNVFSLPPIECVDALGIAKKVDLGPVLRFWKRPKAPIQILLVGHMDTIYELEHSFQSAVRKTDNVINGPGVADMKGGLCIMLEALKMFEQSPCTQQLGWEVLINPDEEIGSPGSNILLRQQAKLHNVGLLFEPAMDEEGTMAGARKGSGKFIVIVHGRAAHAGRDFHEGRNAIVALAEIISQIEALNGKQDGITFNVGQVRGGEAINVVPALAVCRLDVRIQHLEEEGWVLDRLNAIVATANQKEGFKVEIQGKFSRKPKVLTGKTQALYDLVAEVGTQIGQTIRWKPSGGCCDGNNLSEAGLANVDTLGVCGGKIHSEEEYLLVDSLVSRAKLTTALLMRLSEGKFIE
jgi:glutamate carboxypeptidase